MTLTADPQLAPADVDATPDLDSAQMREKATADALDLAATMRLPATVPADDPRQPTDWLTYFGDVTTGLHPWTPMGPTGMRDYVWPVSAVYDIDTHRTRVGFSYAQPAGIPDAWLRTLAYAMGPGVLADRDTRARRLAAQVAAMTGVRPSGKRA